MKKQEYTPAPFLPMTRKEMDILGWDALDVLLVTGDAYVDHPSFGAAIIGRVLEAAGYRVGILAQPDIEDPAVFRAMGIPKLFVGVTAGAMDSMVANMTANKRPRQNDAYTPGGKKGMRPNYATVAYTSVVRHALPGIPVVLGGIEASLRRFAHYDFWRDRVRRSVLLDSKADLIVAGMGEGTVLEVADRLKAGKHLHAIPGTVEVCSAKGFSPEIQRDAVTLASFETVRDDKRAYLDTALHLETALSSAANASAAFRPPIIQAHGDRLVIEWAARPMTPQELDAVYALPYQRSSHPSYSKPIPALESVRFSVVSHRGCFGGCSFCALSLHQGRSILSRTEESVLKEIEGITKHPAFRGTISDVGGPTANMYGMKGKKEPMCARCKRPSCVFPEICPNLDFSHRPHLRLLTKAKEIPGVKHLFIASGIRHDLLLDEEGRIRGRDGVARPQLHRATGKKKNVDPVLVVNEKYFILLLEGLVGGHLSVAPEHVAKGVLRRMRKPPIESFQAFSQVFEEFSAKLKRQQFMMPYFIASFPGSTEDDMKTLMRFLKIRGRKLRQVQDFLPGPMSIASAMYHSELDLNTKRPIFVAKTAQDRKRQRDLLQYYLVEEREKEKERQAEKGKGRSGGKGRPGAKSRTAGKGRPTATRCSTGRGAAKGRDARKSGIDGRPERSTGRPERSLGARPRPERSTGGKPERSTDAQPVRGPGAKPLRSAGAKSARSTGRPLGRPERSTGKQGGKSRPAASGARKPLTRGGGKKRGR